MRLICATLGSALLLSTGCNGTVSVTDAIRCWNLSRDPTPLTRIDAAPVDGHPSIWVARCDTQEDWSGFFGCYGIRDGRVCWQARVDREPTEQSIFTVRGFRHPFFSGLLVEVVGRTHMGNGSLYLYELKGVTLKLRLETRAYDCNHDLQAFRDNVLRIEYPFGPTGEVILHGTIDEYGEEDDDTGPLRSWACRKVFRWNPAAERFDPDLAQWIGIDPDQ